MNGKYDGYGRYGSYMAYMPHVVDMPYVGDPGCEGYMGHIGGTRWRCRRDGPGGDSLFKTGALRALEPTDAPAPAQSSPIQKQSGISATTEASIYIYIYIYINFPTVAPITDASARKMIS